MKELNITLPVQYKFFGGAKPIEEQSFETKLEKFRQKAYDYMPEEHNNLRARCVIDNGINSIKTILNTIWNTPEQLAVVSPLINVDLRMDNDYTAYFIAVRYSHSSPFASPKYEIYTSENYDEAIQAEKDEFLQKYGFTELPQKQYRVEFENHEAVLSDRQLKEINKEHPELYYKLLIKDAT